MGPIQSIFTKYCMILCRGFGKWHLGFNFNSKYFTPMKWPGLLMVGWWIEVNPRVVGFSISSSLLVFVSTFSINFEVPTTSLISVETFAGSVNFEGAATSLILLDSSDLDSRLDVRFDASRLEWVERIRLFWKKMKLKMLKWAYRKADAKTTRSYFLGPTSIGISM